ncbi:MAG: Asp23/Gls24 family envelope stress response protein [Clostridia bacterium]
MTCYTCVLRVSIVGGFPPRKEAKNNMECKIKNDIGTIYITEDVMLKVVGYAALECYGIVAMSSKRAKDGLVQWLGRENLSKGVQLRLVDDMLDVELFIIVEYGISIAEVCKTIVETVRYKLESMTGVKVRRVNISVEGVRV